MNQHASLFALVTCTLVTACVGLPSTSRTGQSSVVTVTNDTVSPRDVVVRPGDEVKIVNRRNTTIWVYFNRESLDELACQQGFSYFWGVEESAKVEPGESASLCFKHDGAYGYSVQAQPTVQGGARLGEIDIPASTPGAVIVEPAARSSR